MNIRAFARRPLAQAVSIVLGTTVLVPAFSAEESPEQLDEVVVTGIRGSLTSSMNLKRESQGVVDGIVAEDIGKFPDTNLAESLQRISGVSIDRNAGEGSRITVRGVGPDFNLVLLNGRQMPGASIGETFASNSRSFDFANLASESISAVEVYKTSRAANSTGGIGASVNIRTARPLEQPGTRFNLGVKGVMDMSADNLPSNIQGDSVTPELSGDLGGRHFRHRVDGQLPGTRRRLQHRVGGQRLASVRCGRGRLGRDSAGRRARLGTHHQSSKR
jgi:outer membrane cobalamin receptor